MSDNDRAIPSVRKRFFVNGETSAALDMHGRYLKPAHRLLAQVRTGQLVQQQAEVDHEPELVGTTLHGDITRRHYVGGATLRATHKGGLDEVSIDVRSYTVDTQPSGGIKPQPLPYLWVGARIKEEYTTGPDAVLDDSALILGVWEPDHKDGRHRGLVCSHPPMRAIEHVTPRLWEGLQQGTQLGSFFTRHPAVPAVTLTEDGLYMASAFWVAGSSSNMLSVDVGDWCLEAPFDPMRKDTPDEQWRPFYTGLTDYYPVWPHVVVLDAWPQAAPTDGRELLQIPQGLKALGITPLVLAGQYVVKVGLNDVVCEPVTVEIEVHLNKQPHTIVKRYEVTITHGTDYYRLMHPYGVPTEMFHGCDYEVGDNPHWRNWWAGALLVDVLGGTIKPEPYHVPTHGFTPGPWSSSLDGCSPSGLVVRVLYFALQFPFSNAWMGAYKAQVLAVTEYAFDANPSTVSTGLEAIWGRATAYPVSASNSYWQTEGNPPQIPSTLAMRIERAEAHGVIDGVVYQVIYDSRLDWPARFSITSKPSMNSQTLAGDPFAYQAEMIAIANALEATSLSVTVPGAHFNPIDLESSSSECITPTDTQTDGSPAVEVEPT